MLVPVVDFGPNPGALDMYEYAPADLPSGRPVVVVMHGCTQQADSVLASGWNTLADQVGFTVVYPQQRSSNHPLSCFTWYDPDDNKRDSGEAASVIQMVDHALAAHGGDRNRVYVTGMSAGGAFTAIMLALYPERFAAGSSMAGIPYGCADDLVTAQACTKMSASSQKTAEQWGALARAANPSFTGAFPRMQIWQGAQDLTVAPANGTELVKQWTNLANTDATADATDTFGSATRTRYTAGGTVAVELYTVAGMGHAIAIGDDALGACPARAAAFYSNAGVCSTLHAAAFFGLAPAGSDTDPDGDGDPGTDDDDGGTAGGCSATREPSWLVLLAACALVAGARRTRARGSTSRRPGSNRHRR